MILEENNNLKRQLESQKREAEITLVKVMYGLESIKAQDNNQTAGMDTS